MEYIILVISYLIGSIPFGLLVGKGIYKTDIRKHGSGNLGGTNTFRVLGKTAGILVTLGDLLKGTLAASLPLIFGVEMNLLVAGIPAILGHCYPVFAGFRGGKAVATTAGVLLFAYPFSILIGVIIFATTLKLTKYVSLTSIVSALGILIYSFIIDDFALKLFSLFIFLFVLIRHRSNLKRIKEKTEPKVPWI